MKPHCRICRNTENNRIHRAREMMFGTRDRFDYLECRRCGTLQITEIPDLTDYYPKDYYSLDRPDELEFLDTLQKRLAVRLAGNYFVNRRSISGKYVADRKKWVHDLFPASLREPLLDLNFRSRILDFGCGAGRLLHILRRFGFRDLTGADAFIEADIRYPNGIKIFKKTLSRIEPFFDLVMLHHSFEHLPEPLEALREIFALVETGGFCLVRIPVVNFAWEKYGVNWVQLDPPRHLFLYPEQSFRRLAEQAGFSVRKVVYDSEEFQFWASEYYARDIAMNEPGWFNGNFSESIFTEAEFNGWKEQAAQLNADGRGDQACFYLQKN